MNEQHDLEVETTTPRDDVLDPRADLGGDQAQFPPGASSAPGSLATAPVPEPAAVASGLQMKRRNPIAAWIGLPLITLGIYHLVWYYKIHHEMSEFDRRRSIPTAGPMLVLLFLSWTVISPLISYYNAGGRIRNAQRAAGLAGTCSGGIGVLLMFVFGLGTLYYQSELNKIVDRYGPTPPGNQVPLYV